MQTQKPSPKIPNALVNAPEECLQQKIQDRYGYSNQRKTYREDSISQATEAALLKYYPKYCYAIRLDRKPKPHPVLHRIKQIKTISHLEYELQTTRKSFIVKTMKKLFHNKRKSLKSLPIIGYVGEPACRIRRLTAMEMCYFFPQIETLKVRLPTWGFSYRAQLDYIPGPLEDQILDCYGHFWDVLKHVKHLHLDFNPNLWVILPHLEKSQRFLSSLQSFRITILSHRMDSTDTPQKKFLSFLRTPDVLKYVTHINFQNFKDNAERGWFHYYGDQIKSILDYCDRLQSIIFPIEEEFYNSQSQFAGSKHYLTLAPLKSFNRLDSLDLMVYDTWSLLKGFELPPQLQRLALRLYNLYPIWNKNDEEKSLDKDQVLTRFFEKVSKLTQLSSLELNLCLSTTLNEVLNELILPMLQAVPQLEKFECNLYRIYEKVENPLNLSFLLRGMLPLTKLQSLKISQQASDENGPPVIAFDPQAQERFSFPNINSINIDSVISEDFDFRAFFMALSKGSNQKEINLAKISVSSIQSLLKLFKIFKEAEQLPNLKINLGVIVSLQNWEDIDKYLQEPILLAKNVSLSLKMKISSADKTHPPAERIIILQKVFAKMKFSLTMLVKKMVGRWSPYETIDSVPLIRNNHYSPLAPLEVAQDEASLHTPSFNPSFRSSPSFGTPRLGTPRGEYKSADTDEFDDESPPRPHPLDDEL